MTLQRLIYTLLLTLIMPIIVLRLFWRSRKNPDYRQGMAGRFAYYCSTEKQSFLNVKVWVHAVSVGETLAAKPLILALIAKYGEGAVFVSSTTPTGFATVKRLFSNKVQQHYFPNDLPWLVSRALKAINPQLFIAIETEIWPNFWKACEDQKIPIFLINARLSTRSTARYKKLYSLVSETLQRATLIACRAKKDANNFLEIGALQDNVKVLGDIKWDSQNSEALFLLGQQFKQQWKGRLVLVAASTHEGEDALILSLYQTLCHDFDHLLLVIVPRHPERFDQVAHLILEADLSLYRRSADTDFITGTDVVLGDSMGEMEAWFSASDLVLMGGSLVNVGGHNPMEAAACGVPVISGPMIHNFTEAFDILTQQNVAYVSKDIDDMTQYAKQLLIDNHLRKTLGKTGLKIVAQNRGATQRLMAKVAEVMDDSS
ncbi:MAG: lipid IV(A) 3-deoxy-D-manno-octulosonic acid transferase [Thiotrichaceae bacterium]|nr:lipid IV(A) 3-deoxy-D-manno-octulosonic acid transferase [Thiotrichaceae bacterium]